ncbi:hypothetical protein M5J14_08030 [Lysinibacillus sp. OL1_EC]|uniref:hypothetical protein n=1 Tax=unclassified Lysinibacillus TaxID=2636778 RepID=UPI001039EE87|nr:MULTISPECIES: hypothetical protein [unclassified Lysinibacillus]MCM0624475.1 hypothetical protein [Lysinibacillus sp. OL1_EC]MCS5500837.1 hypothetical protein [Lysinibacillus sp. A4]TBV88254.1 hypothetical protein EW028_07400 [Lysinibacillus sp. OL1]UKJ44249.1 hypothetical protein L6W14_15970 [Lysinibacillus sp. ACHW1.5]
MKKPAKKTWLLASALTLGMAVLTPLQAGATAVDTTNNVTIQIEQKITGTIKYFDGGSITLKGTDGKNYYIGLHNFSDKQIEQLKLAEGQEILVEGSIVKDYSDFFTFAVYKKSLPKEVTKEELVQLEKLFSDMKKAEKEENYEEMERIYQAMDNITRPYELANWQPEPFEEFINEAAFAEKNIVIKAQDKEQLKTLYSNWIKYVKENKTDEASENIDKIFTILEPYYQELYPPLTFEEYMADMNVDLTKEELAKLKTLYEEAQKAEKDKDEELAMKKWDAFYEILRPHFKPVPFEEYMADIEFSISNADYAKLKQHYEEAVALEQKGEDEKAGEQWEAFYKVLDPYYEANREILISPSKLTFNGQDFTPEPETN